MLFSISGTLLVENFIGHRYNYTGEKGKTYTLFKQGKLEVTGRVSLDGLYLENISVQAEAHNVSIDHTAVLVDGNPPTEAMRKPGGWVWVHDGRVTVGVAGYVFGVILDDGNGDAHKEGSLKGVAHVSMFARVVKPQGCSGILVD